MFALCNEDANLDESEGDNSTSEGEVEDSNCQENLAMESKTSRWSTFNNGPPLLMLSLMLLGLVKVLLQL